MYTVICVLFWTFSLGSQRSFCLAGCPHGVRRGVRDRAGGEAHPAGPSPSQLGSCGGPGCCLHHESGLLGVGGCDHPHDRQGEERYLSLGLHSPYFLATFLFNSKFLLRAYFLSIFALLLFLLLLKIALMIAYMDIEQVVSATGSTTICSISVAY
jgi:hypothetical protein